MMKYKDLKRGDLVVWRKDNKWLVLDAYQILHKTKCMTEIMWLPLQRPILSYGIYDDNDPQPWDNLDKAMYIFRAESNED